MSNGPTRILTFLGTSAYHPVAYRRTDNDRIVTRPARFVVNALLELFDDGPHHVAIFLTEDAEEVNFGKLKSEQETFRIPSTHKKIRIRNGSTADELRNLFGNVRAMLTSNAIDELEESQPPGQIILDVTHGFRIQPLLAMAAIAEVQNRWMRELEASGRTEVPRLRIVYGSYDPRNASHLPTFGDATWTPERRHAANKDASVVEEPVRIADLWELEEFLLQSDFSRAVDALLRFGRGDDLNRMLRDLDDAARVPGEADRAWLRDTARSIHAFSDALCLAQAPDLLQNKAPELLDRLDRVPPLMKAYPAAEDALQALKRQLERIALREDQSTVSPQSLEAYQHLAHWYLKLQRFAETMALIAEAEGVWAAAHQGQPIDTRPGTKGFSDQWRHNRTWIDRARMAVASEAHEGAAVSHDGAGARLDKAVRDVRNTISHAGFRDNIDDPAALRQTVEQAVSAFSTLAVPAGTIVDQGCATLPARLLFGVSGRSGEALEATDEAVDRETERLSAYKKAKDPMSLCEKAGRILEEVAKHHHIHSAWFGPLTTIEDMPLALELQRRGVPCHQWRVAGSPHEPIESRNGRWIEMPSASRLLGLG